MAGDPAGEPGLILASRSRTAFAVSLLDPFEKSESYEIFRHPAGGRKDVSLELDPSQPRTPSLAGRMADEDRRELEAAGVIDSKFGNVALSHRPGRFDPAKSCLGFLGHFADPALQISGWSCEGASLPARHAAIACMLDRLTIRASKNEPRLEELFARAELKRGGCGTTAAVSPDRVTAAENPCLRGAP